MARFSRLETALQMKETGIVPVFYHSNPEVCKNVIKACYDGGIRVFEFTNRGDFAHEVFSEINKYVIREFPDMIMGVGSVVDEGTASLYIQLGANFVVSPLFNEQMVKVCNRRKIFCSPGCGSVSEISEAEALGVEIVKIFPGGQVGGPGFVKAVKGPCPWTDIMPTGGVSPDEENLKEWFQAGVACVGMGSRLITKDKVQNGDYEGIKQNVQNTLAIVRDIRQTQ